MNWMIIIMIIMSQVKTTRNQKKSMSIGARAGIAVLVPGIIVIVLLAAFVWIPGSQTSPDASPPGKPFLSTLSFSSLPDGTDLSEFPSADTRLFVDGGPSNEVRVTAGVAWIIGTLPIASLIFRPAQEHVIIGESIEIQCLIQSTKINEVTFTDTYGKRFVSISNNGEYFVVNSKSYQFDGLKLDDKVTMTLFFTNVTNCMVTIETNGITKIITTVIGTAAMTTSLLSSVNFSGAYTAGVVSTTWKLISVKVTWENAFTI